MPTFLFVEKSGNMKEIQQPTIIAEDLYKKVGFKSADGFDIQATWNKPNAYNIKLYARKKGRAGSENKYDFPPPIESVLFFGGCVLVNQDETTGEYKDLTKTEWKTIYEELFGGFEDIGETESETDESEADLPKTKEGYVKDGFIVEDEPEVEEEENEDEDDDDDDEEDDIETESDDIDTDDLCEEPEIDEDEDECEPDDEDEPDSEDEYETTKSKKSKKPSKEPVKKAAVLSIVKPKPTVGIKAAPKHKSKPTIVSKQQVVEPLNGNYLNCSDELAEEEYL